MQTGQTEKMNSKRPSILCWRAFVGWGGGYNDVVSGKCRVGRAHRIRRLKSIFEGFIRRFNERLGADNPGVGKIAGSVSKPSHPRNLKSFEGVIIKHFLRYVRPTLLLDSPNVVDIFAVFPESGVNIIHAEIRQPEIKRKTVAPVFLLYMITNGAPSVILRALHDFGTHGIEVDIREAIDQRVSMLNDHAFESLSPKGFSALFPPIEKWEKLCLMSLI